MTIHKVVQFLESVAPPVYQESYDNSGLLVGDPIDEVSGVICCLDATERVVEEAIQKKCNLIIAHHPIVFKGIKRLNGSNYVERVLIRAIRHKIAIYAIHTNLDNMLYRGVNTRIAEQLKLRDCQILAPKKSVRKMAAYVPTEESDHIRNALFTAGAGQFNHQQQVSFASLGVGTASGQGLGRVKLEMLFPMAIERTITGILDSFAASHGIHYEISQVGNKAFDVGSGMIGNLAKPMKEKKFLKHLKEQMNVSCIRHTSLPGKEISSVAVCGGAGGFLLSHAIRQKADIFITADYKYHEFFDADQQIIIADIGHYESEQFTIQLLQELISQKFRNFAAHCTEVNTNPVEYYF